MKLFIDGDAFPNMIKEVTYKNIIKHKLQTYVIANKKISIGKQSQYIHYLIVEDGLDKADDLIVSMIKKNDLAITADIPLADRIVSKEAMAIDHRGELFDKENIKHYLAMRNLMQEIRDAGEYTKGPAPFTKKDTHNFATQINNILYTKLNKTNICKLL